jgi:hypothetical protein
LNRPALFALIAAAAVAGGAAGLPEAESADASAAAAGAVPDLAVRRDGFSRAGDTLRVVVENLGDAAAPATVLELSDRPFSGGPSGTSSHYRPVPGTSAMWIDQEPAGPDAVRLRVSLGRGLDPVTASGEMRFLDAKGVRLESGPSGATVTGGDGEDPRVTWALPLPPEGAELVLNVGAEAGSPPRVRLTQPPGEKLPPPVYTADARLRNSVVELTLDCLDRPAARRARIPVPALRPGERASLAAVFAGGALGEVSAWIDPDDGVPETREGNNIATRADDAGRWSLAALHVHSCFSEGPGSFDWQAWQAARSGYDLVWWSEHDWRVACRDHLGGFGFEDEDPINVDFEAEGPGAQAERTRDEVSGGARAVLLRTGSAGGTCRARVRSDRKRLAYTLASDVEIGMRILARDLRAGDVLTVGFDLSYHPAGARSLIYRLRWEGADAPGAEGGSPWAPEIPRTLPTGGWVTVRFPVSDDAAARWPNGLDDNLTGMWMELDAEGAAEVRLDDVTVEHRLCGLELIAVQEEWTAFYPNLAHRVGGEISYIAPHLIRFGGDPALLLYDLERERGEESAPDEAAGVVRVVHARGGLVSWAHPLGVNRIGNADPDALVAAIGDDLSGADALEVGYRNRGGASLASHLELWDRLSVQGLVVTALGVNDSHHNQWSPSENNFATWLEASADDEAALLRAIGGGHAFFGDPVLFRGRAVLDVGGVPMGGIATGEGPRTARVRFTEIGEERTVRLIADGRLLREWTGISGSGVLSEALAPGDARTVRAEIRGADGEPLAFTNPVFLDPSGTLRRGGE